LDSRKGRVKSMKINRKVVKEYPETHQQGSISMESNPFNTSQSLQGDLGIQISKDGRVWICINGEAFLRFRPKRKGEGNERKM